MSDLELLQQLETNIGLKLEQVREERFQINAKNIAENNIVNKNVYAMSDCI